MKKIVPMPCQRTRSVPGAVVRGTRPFVCIALGEATAVVYDALGSPVSVTDPLGRVVSMSRDALGRMTSFTDPAGNLTAFAYDAEDHVTQVKDAVGDVTSFAYKPGRISRLPSSVVDANNHATTFNYDVLGRVTSVVNADNQSGSVAYDVMSRVKSVTNRNGQSFTFAYDNLDRLTTLTAPEGSINLSYDAVGNLTSASSYNGSSLNMAYDALDRVTSVVQSLPGGYSATLGYAYDANGNRTQMTTPWGIFRYAYDSLNRVTSITNPFGQTVTFQYDALGRRTKMTYPNGVVTTYAYDAAGQLTQIVAQRSSDHSAVAFESYAYDANGNRTSVTDLTGTHTYTYDKLNRLTSASHPAASGLPILNETFSYDAVGNRLADAAITGYQYDAANRLTQNSSFTYTYDANGNTTSRTNRATGEKWTFIYDSFNELVEVDGSTYTIATYKYDATGRRLELDAAGSLIRYVYDGPNVIAILDGNGQLLQLFTQGPGVDRPLIMRQAGTDYFYHADALSSIVALTSNAGSVVETLQYNAFGRAVIFDVRGNVLPQSGVSNRFQFSGREWDQETGLQNSRMRIYDSVVGRFDQEDLRAAINAYSYAFNSPTVFNDPYGLRPAGPNADCYDPNLVKYSPPVSPKSTNPDEIPDPVDPGILRLYIWLADNVEPYGDGYAIMLAGGFVVGVGGFLTAASIPIAVQPLGWVAAPPVFLSGFGMVGTGLYVTAIGWNIDAGTFYKHTGVDITIPNVPVLTPEGNPPNGHRPWN